MRIKSMQENNPSVAARHLPLHTRPAGLCVAQPPKAALSAEKGEPLICSVSKEKSPSKRTSFLFGSGRRIRTLSAYGADARD